MRTVCLTTPVEDPTRHAAALAHFDEMGVGPVDFVYGLHKDTSGLITTHPYMVDRADPASPEYDEPYHIGAHPTNIWIGHYMVWNALRLSGDYQWLVLECDAKFSPGWPAAFTAVMAEARTHATKYDLIYVGSCCTTGRRATPVEGCQYLYTLAGTAPQCNHAYVVTARAAEVLCTTLRKVWAPIDIQQASECWGDPLPRAVPPVARPARPLQVYTVLPRLVEQWHTQLTV